MRYPLMSMRVEGIYANSGEIRCEGGNAWLSGGGVEEVV